MSKTSFKAAILDVLSSHDKTDEQPEAVARQMFGQCFRSILNNGKSQGKIISRMIKDYEAGQ